MSAFICSDRHIATIATYFTRDIGRPDAAQAIADYLLAENIASVNHRYNEETLAEPCDLSEVAIDLYPHDLVALCHCLDYQSCEHRDDNDVVLETIDAHFTRQVTHGVKSPLWSI